ncbi:MAG: haloacid dehalogenase type II [Pseudomonadota bacterium]
MVAKALVFDVFGTCVDWRTTIINEGRFLGQEKGLGHVDWAAFADAWRAGYQPAMEEVRTGRRNWTILDVLHRENLERLLPQFDISGLDDGDIDHLNRVWHRLQPWPDVVSGLRRLKEKFVIGPLSNGNVALLVNMAKRSGLPWDVILGAEVAGHYKPQPKAYLTAVRLLGLAPDQVMMVAAHNSDLQAAGALGLKTAFVPRPTEHGPDQAEDLVPTHDYDLVATDFGNLADQLGA